MTNLLTPLIHLLRLKKQHYLNCGIFLADQVFIGNSRRTAPLNPANAPNPLPAYQGGTPIPYQRE